jgi:quinoprotein glucose dehydrogenase
VTADDLIDLTPELKAEALKMMADYQIGPLFRPSLIAGTNGYKGRLHLPSQSGGANWAGAAVDAETGVLYVSSHTSLAPTQLVHNPKSEFAYVQGGGGEGGGGAAAAKGEIRVFGPQGLPMAKPPWGRITAIDMNTGEHLWMVPNGDTPDYVKNHPALKGVNIPRTGKAEHPGIMVTKTLVIAGEGAGMFAVPAGSGGPMLYAYDKRTGDVVGEFKMPANQTGIPMTYMLNGKQYIVVAIGGRNYPGELITLALP